MNPMGKGGQINVDATQIKIASAAPMKYSRDVLQMMDHRPIASAISKDEQDFLSREKEKRVVAAS